MPHKYDWRHEFPGYYDRIIDLQSNNNHFACLFEEYQKIIHQVLLIEENLLNQTNMHLECLKKKSLLYKDKLYGMIVNK